MAALCLGLNVLRDAYTNMNIYGVGYHTALLWSYNQEREFEEL